MGGQKADRRHESMTLVDRSSRSRLARSTTAAHRCRVPNRCARPNSAADGPDLISASLLWHDFKWMGRSQERSWTRVILQHLSRERAGRRADPRVRARPASCLRCARSCARICTSSRAAIARTCSVRIKCHLAMCPRSTGPRASRAASCGIGGNWAPRSSRQRQLERVHPP